MTGQFREEIGGLRNTCGGETLWIVGAGPSLDDVDLGALKGEYIFALNSAGIFFGDRRKFPNAWWVWWDLRAYREIWPHMQKDHVQAIVHKRGNEMMRSHKGSGRFIYYKGESLFKPVRTVLETALLIGEFLGFDRANLVGVDGMVARDGKPYCSMVNEWKRCHFMDTARRSSWQMSARAFGHAMHDLIVSGRIKHMCIYQTSPIYPRDDFKKCTMADALSDRRKEKIDAKKRKKVSSRSHARF